MACSGKHRPPTPPPLTFPAGQRGRRRRGAHLVLSLIDTCNEETFRQPTVLRPGPARAPARPPLGRPGNRAGLGPRRRGGGGRATAHLPGTLGPHAAWPGRRLPQAAAAQGGRRTARGPQTVHPNRPPLRLLTFI